MRFPTLVWWLCATYPVVLPAANWEIVAGVSSFHLSNNSLLPAVNWVVMSVELLPHCPLTNSLFAVNWVIVPVEFLLSCLLMIRCLLQIDWWWLWSSFYAAPSQWLWNPLCSVLSQFVVCCELNDGACGTPSVLAIHHSVSAANWVFVAVEFLLHC